MGQDKRNFSGLSPDKLKQPEQKPEDQDAVGQALDDKIEQSSQEEAQPNESTQESSPQEDKAETQDADPNVDKYKNLLVNTFGFDEGEITEKDIKLAKSYAEAQSGMTKSRQEALDYKQTVDGLQQVFKKAPSLYEQLVAVAQGKEPENLSTEENRKSDNSQNIGQLEQNSTVSEQELIQGGYLSKEDLNGLDDLAKERVLAKAELRYDKDKLRQEYRNELQQERKTVQEQAQQEQAQAANRQRVDKGWDDYVMNYGVNFSEVSDDQLQQIKQNVQYIRDPQNPNLISEDAVEIAANRVLGNSVANKNPVKPSGKTVEGLTDSGKSVSKSRGNASGEKTQEEQLRQMAIDNFRNTSNPKRHKQNLRTAR